MGFAWLDPGEKPGHKPDGKPVDKPVSKHKADDDWYWDYSIAIWIILITLQVVTVVLLVVDITSR